MKPLIGITAGEIENGAYPWAPIVYGQGRTYVDAVIRAGGVPIILPITDDLSVLSAISKKLDGLLLSGGNDINPRLYGEDPYVTTSDISERRDEAEMFLLQEALVSDKPVLGICRGMQLLNVACGGSLYQDIRQDLPHASDHLVSKAKQDFEIIAHTIRLQAGSRTSEILGTQHIAANTLHHQAIKTLGKDMTAVGWSEDGLIEAIELTTDQIVIGIQAHPEALESSVEPTWQKLFSAFIDAANTRVSSRTSAGATSF